MALGISGGASGVAEGSMAAASADDASVTTYKVGEPDNPIGLDQIFDDLLNLIAGRNPDFSEFDAGRIKRVSS